MSQLVVLNLGTGSWSQGCPTAIAQLWQPGTMTPMQFVGSLPPAPQLGRQYVQYQQLYEALYAHKSWRRTTLEKPILEIDPDDTEVNHISESEFHALCHALKRDFNHWLNTLQFQSIDRSLRTYLIPTDEIRVIITSSDRDLQRFPWSLWQFFDTYPRAELALSLPEYTRAVKTASSPSGKVKILAVLGDCQGIDITADQQLLEHLPQAEVKFLVEPDRFQLSEQLWDQTSEQGWDMLFFAGHSSTQAEGRIRINRTDSLSLEQLRHGLRRAIERGLKLAIFNSCDGLGLAWDLADLQIPQVIVMREPVADQVAQAFLKYFLVAFSSGRSLHLSVREARERLQDLETEFPTASWLPVLYQNPAELPQTWQQWCGNIENLIPSQTQPAPVLSQTPSAASFTIALPKIIRALILSSMLATGLITGLRSLGFLQPLELWAFDRLLTLRPAELPDPRLLIVTIDETDIQSQNPDERRGSISDDALSKLLLKLKQAKARVIGLDVYRDFSVSPGHPELAAQFQNNARLILICKSSDAQFDQTGIAAPPSVPDARVGFSDFLEDNDGLLRRHLIALAAPPNSPCATPYSFSTQLAFHYLATASKPILPAFTPDGNLKFDKTILPRLHDRTAGYQTIDAQGNQIILNYRALPTPQAIAPQVSLTQVLQGKVNPSAIQDRIVLIGVTAPSSTGDLWTTPYGSGTAASVFGIFLQAQMTSQIVSAVLDHRSLITGWTWTGEILWILAWSGIGGIVAIGIRRVGYSLLSLGGTIAVGIGILTSASLFLLCQGFWVPLIPAGLGLILVSSSMAYWQMRQFQIDLK